MLQAILFDLDGTLLPMDYDAFTQSYFSLLAKKAREWGYEDSELLIRAIWGGTKAMVKNTGETSNEEVFWKTFSQLIGRDAKDDVPQFDTFYENEFHMARAATVPTPLAREAVRMAREKAERVILATNPIFPRVGTRARLSWLGLSEADFDWVTDYGNSRFCKPNPAYYISILERFGLSAAQCLMVGNDAEEDMVAATRAGIPVYMVTDCLINRQNTTMSCPNGSFSDMIAYLQAL